MPCFERLLLAAVVLGAGAACAGPRGSEDVPPFVPLTAAELGGMHNVSFSEGWWLGSAPTPADLDLAKRRGVERVVSIQHVDERSDDLRRACGEMDLEYVEMNVRHEIGLSDRLVDRILPLFADGRSTLLFCEDGARSAAMFAVHRAVDQGMPIDTALQEARAAGMRPGESEEWVREQVERIAVARRR